MTATNAAKLSCKPLIIFVGAPEEIRTPDPQIRSLVLRRSKLTSAGFITLEVRSNDQV